MNTADQRTAFHLKVGPVVLAYVAFVALGLPDGLLGVAWPSVRATFSIPLDAIGMLMTASVAGYLTTSFLSGPLVSRLGIGKVLPISCTLIATALIGYTLVPAWWMMVLLGILAGSGAGAIDAGLNGYIAANFNEGMMQWLHASYGIGITLSPLIMTAALSTFASWRIGYRTVAGIQLALAVVFLLTLSMWNRRESTVKTDEAKQPEDYKSLMREALSRPKVWMSVSLFFLYVGGELSLGTWIYSLLTLSRGINPTLAGLIAGSFWATFTISRILAGLYARRVGADHLIQGSIAAALVGVILLIWNPSQVVNLLAVVLIGFSIAPTYPALMSGTKLRVGERFAANVIGMQVAAAGLGGALIPSLLGVLANHFSLEVIPICMLVDFMALFGMYRLSMISRKTNEESVL
jgi:fucose permease